jgi:hypothetical protein
MFVIVHRMRTRIMTSPVFTGERIVGANEKGSGARAFNADIEMNGSFLVLSLYF